MNSSEFLLTYECMNSIGNSLNLKEMLKEFSRTVVKRTSAISAKVANREDCEEILSINKKKFDLNLDIELTDNIIVVNNTTYLVLFLDDVVCVFQYNNSSDIDFLWLSSVLKSFIQKLNNSIKSCKAYEEKELQVKIEVEKNKKKDLMIQQQSRLAQMGEMISMIAHQWRQPLASISAIAVSMQIKLGFKKYDFSTQEGQDKFINYLDKQVHSVENLVEVLTTTIDDFRDFYKPNKEQNKVNINTPIKKALEIIEKQIEFGDITVIKDFDIDDEILVYDSELMQVYLNILKNAIDNFKNKSIKNKIIRIKTIKKDGNYLISLCDNGGGISDDIIDKIFDPYFSTKDAKNGTGLGLYMSKTIVVDHHKGNFYAKNTDNGVCFYIELDGQI